MYSIQERIKKCFFLLWPLQNHNIIVRFYNSYLDRNYREFPLVFNAKSDKVPPKTMEIILCPVAYIQQKKRRDVHIN